MSMTVQPYLGSLRALHASSQRHFASSPARTGSWSFASWTNASAVSCTAAPRGSLETAAPVAEKPVNLAEQSGKYQVRGFVRS